MGGLHAHVRRFTHQLPLGRQCCPLLREAKGTLQAGAGVQPCPPARPRRPAPLCQEGGEARTSPQHAARGGTILNDIALVELSEPVECSDYIQPACLPDSRASLANLRHCYISGWGNPSPKKDHYPDILQEGKVDFIPRRNCSRLWKRVLPPMNLCAGLEQGGLGTCQGDRGGPVQCRAEGSERYWVLGVLSWGPPACGTARRPSVFISLQHFHDWIQQQTKEDFSKPYRLPLFARIPTPPPRPPPLPPTALPSGPASWVRPPLWARPSSSWIPPGRNPSVQWHPWSPSWPRTTRWHPRTRHPGWIRPTHWPRLRHHSPHPLQP
ncbi:hypothetical protein JRQ81_015561 [Phrynocephalus forsythii]|uniref:Peptidase S1 domain-containing protein n=1 Tax=Phrynocephalus forsythii TaxID=171643 RepID=A0A9Q1B2E6_9SAUR|nr:hypothetical protein JRQ81_015561 [Phrynocephalus forsythii]